MPIAGFAKKIRVDLAKFTETLALGEALRFFTKARKLGARSILNESGSDLREDTLDLQVVLQSDSLSTIDSVSSRIKSPWTTCLLISECRGLLAHLKGVVVKFCPREANYSAD